MIIYVKLHFCPSDLFFTIFWLFDVNYILAAWWTESSMYCRQCKNSA